MSAVIDRRQGRAVFFADLAGLARVVVVGTLAYAALVLLLRISGKRTLSKMSAFDFVVTVALGSTLATVLLSRDVALAEGIVAFALLCLLQFVISWLSVRFERVEDLVKARPRLLVHRGRLLRQALVEERVTLQEIRAASRAQGLSSLEEAGAVVLETDGSITVMREIGAGDGSTLTGVRGPGLGRPL